MWGNNGIDCGWSRTVALMVKRALIVVRSARRALEVWQELPAEERESTRADAERVSRLAAELTAHTGRTAAQRLRRSEADPVGADDQQARDTEQIVAELVEAVQRLGDNPLTTVATDAARPRTRRGRLALRVVSGTARGAHAKWAERPARPDAAD